jgi:aminoglycoside phosphotransferase (APT) family kinase protein
MTNETSRKPMHLDPELIDAMFARHGVTGAWEALPSTGVANHVFATRDLVLRVATDHPDAVPDARTESVAAPVAHAAGILTPRLIGFDDTRRLVGRPFSLWERVHGETLGMATLSPRQATEVWRGVGRELAKLHRVRECADPDGYLDEPGRDRDVGAMLKRLVDARRVDIDTARRVERLTEELQPYIAQEIEPRFIHDDIHPMNVMCSSEGELVAILDWGDAGWGDPTLDFAAMPFEAIRPALEGYEAEEPGALDASPEVRVAWNKLLDAVDDLWDIPARSLDLEAFHAFVRAGMR